VFVLGDAEAPADDAAVGVAVDLGRLADIGLAHTGFVFDLVP
jgi:hypothetical protein